MQKRTIAALQLGSEPAGTQATLAKILGHTTSIKQSGCDLLLLPEALLGGYPKGADFGARVGYRTEQGREQFLSYWHQAIDLDGPEVKALCKLAESCSTDIVIGVVERGGATLYCTALFISSKGRLVAKHRKLQPTASERLIWGQGDGSTLPAVNTNAGIAGAVICWENYMPLLRAAMYAKGVQVWCAPTVDDRDHWQTTMRHIAYEGRQFVISACQYVPPPNDHDRRDDSWPSDKALIRGGSVIVSPMGEVLTGPLYDREGLVCTEVDLDDVIRARYDFDPVGHYSRPDIFSLSVDERRRPASHSRDSD